MNRLLTTTSTSAGRTTVAFTGTLDISTIDQALKELTEATAQATTQPAEDYALTLQHRTAAIIAPLHLQDTDKAARVQASV